MSDTLIKRAIGPIGPPDEKNCQCPSYIGRDCAFASLYSSHPSHMFRSSTSLDGDLFTVMADSAPVMIWMADTNAQRTFLNKPWLDFTGRSLDEEVGDGWVEGVHEQDRSACVDAYLAAYRERQPLEIEYRLRRADGEFRWVIDRGAPRLDADGRFTGYIGACVDVTALKQSEARLRESEAQLRRLAARFESAQEHERASVARELHDELGQSLTALKLEMARTVPDLLKQGIGHDTIDRLQSMIGTLDTAQETVRRLATSLRPPALDHLGLAAAIELEGAALARRTGIRCRVVGNRRVARLDSVQTTAVFRIVQEALTNIVRHAGASAITISISGTARSTSVKVRDNGRGMSEKQMTDPAAIGLLGMRERAELIGASLTITSHPGKGTIVSVVASAGTLDEPSRT
jgi:PAS domain S-box-containing protein